MNTLQEILMAESTECEFKESLETKKVKDWLKTVSAFANGTGGIMLFGIANDKNIKGLADIQKDGETISNLIKMRITPLPEFTLTPYNIDGKDILAVRVPGGDAPPYFYQADGAMMAYVRVGSESNPASSHRLKELVLKGKNLTFDSLPTEYKQSDLTFTVFEAAYKKAAKKAFSPKEYVSFGMSKPDGTLTYAGLLFADDCPLLQARVFCTHWNGITKGSVGDDAIDSEEFEGDIISLLKNSYNFVRLNSKVRWRKMSDHRVDKPDYADRAVFEALANALMHRDYSIIGSEVHVDVYDDRLDIYSPGGMVDGSLIQNLNIEEVPSLRRNPTIADVFHRLDYVERRGSGLKKIRTETSLLYGYTDDFAPKFVSTPSAFHTVLKNMNYDLHGILHGAPMQDTMQVTEKDNRIAALLDFCNIPRTRGEMQQHIGIANRDHFRKSFLKPLIESGQLRMTVPDKPNSRNQQYVKA